MADLSRMFAELNKSIQGWEPLLDKPINQMSQGLGGMLGGALGADPAGFMTEAARKQYAEQQLATADIGTEEGLLEAAKFAQLSGDKAAAAKYMQMQEEMVTRRRSRENAMLDAGNLEIQEEVARKQELAQKQEERALKIQATKIASQRGDAEAARAIAGGMLEPKAYLESIQQENKEVNVARRKEALKESDKVTYTPAQVADVVAIAKGRKDNNAVVGLKNGTLDPSEYMSKVAEADKQLYVDANKAATEKDPVGQWPTETQSKNIIKVLRKMSPESIGFEEDGGTAWFDKEDKALEQEVANFVFNYKRKNPQATYKQAAQAYAAVASQVAPTEQDEGNLPPVSTALDAGYTTNQIAFHENAGRQWDGKQWVNSQ